jgi:acyl-CoA thioesterase YciA
MSEIERQPKGDLQVRTVAMPADANANGDIFGGWVLSQMDIAGGTAAARRANGRVATVAVDAMTFHKPVRIGDILCCHAALARVGRTSLAFDIEAWSIAAGVYREERVLVTEGRYTFVAIDSDGKPRPVDVEE